MDRQLQFGATVVTQGYGHLGPNKNGEHEAVVQMRNNGGLQGLVQIGAAMLTINMFAAGPLAAKTPVKVVAFGDSLTAGFGVAPADAFPAQMERALKARGQAVDLINSGVSGDTAANGLDRLDWAIPDDAQAVIEELGANDGLRGLPLEQTRKNLQTIIDKVKEKYPSCKFVIAGMMVPPNMGNEYSTSFQGIFRDLAKKNNGILIPFLLEGVAGIEKLNQADGIHPNVEGHKIVAKNIAQILSPLL